MKLTDGYMQSDGLSDESIGMKNFTPKPISEVTRRSSTRSLTIPRTRFESDRDATAAQ
jgi:hypothetical protein